MFISTDENGRITATSERAEFLINPIEFEFPADFDFSTIGEYIVENGELVYSRSKQSIMDEIDAEQVKLSSTDWVITKILEEQILGGDISALTMKYADIIEERNKSRTKINELEGLLDE